MGIDFAKCLVGAVMADGSRWYDLLFKAGACLVWGVCLFLIAKFQFDGFTFAGLGRLPVSIIFIALSVLTVRVLVMNISDDVKRIGRALLYALPLCILTGIVLEVQITNSGRVGEDANFVNTELIFTVLLYGPIVFLSALLSLFPRSPSGVRGRET